jgi:hypothetical protein
MGLVLGACLGATTFTLIGLGGLWVAAGGASLILLLSARLHGLE